MARISDLLEKPEVDESSDDQNIRTSNYTDEEGNTTADILGASYADMMEGIPDDESELYNESEDEEVQEEEEDETTETTNGDDAADDEEEEGEDGEGEEEQEEKPTTDYSALVSELKDSFDEESLASEEGILEAIRSLKEEKSNYNQDKQVFESVTKLFEDSDEIVEIAKLTKKGYTINEAIASVIDFEEWQSDLKENDPDEYEKVLRRQFEREQELKKAKADREALQQDLEKNKKASSQDWSGFIAEKSLEKTDEQKLQDAIATHFDHLAKGRVTKEFLDVMYRGLKFDDAVQDAKVKGEKEGKNAKISTVRTKQTKRGDGLPSFKGGANKKTGDKNAEPFGDIWSEAGKPKKRLAEI